MKLIAAVDKNWGIGFKGRLLVNIPSDLKRFRQMTLNKVVVLGRATLETFPQKQPLEKRTNIILSTKKDYKVKNAIAVHSLEELMKELEAYDTDDVYIIGGETVYKRLYTYCDEAFITFLDYEYDADAFFPNLDKEEGWKKVEVGEEQTYFDIVFRFNRYIREQ